MLSKIKRHLKMQCSIVVPVYNEGSVLPIFLKRLTELCQNWENQGIITQVVLVDDGSIDESVEIMQKSAPPSSEIVVLERNYGQAIALNAGLDRAKGNYIFTLDADMEFDPLILNKFLSKLKEGYDLVSGVRVIRNTSILRRFASYNINFFSHYLLHIYLRDLTCPVNAYTHSLLEKVKKHGSLLFLKVKAAKCASRVTEVEIEQLNRNKEGSKYNFLKLFALFLEFIVHHSRHIFQRIILLGTGLLIFSLLTGGIYLFLRILGAISPSKIFQALVILIFFTGWQTLIVGFIGEYLLRLHRLLEESLPSYKIKQILEVKNKF